MLPVQHLEDSGLVCLQALGLQLDPLLQLCDPAQLPILLVEQSRELLLVFAGFAKISFVVGSPVALSDAPP